MKLEKREITLNEADSLSDVLVFEKSLAAAYVVRLAVTERKEVRAKFVEALEENARDICIVADLLRRSLEN